LADPPPPELLEQLGIEPHCTCESRDDLYEHYGDRKRGSITARQYLSTGTSGKENLMRDIASATLSGNLTRDVELRELPSGAEVARLRVATTTRRRNGEEWVDKTNYFTVEVYGAQARACEQYLGKGSRVVVDAELDWREWTDQENKRREEVTLRARQVLFEDGRSSNRKLGEGHEGDGTPAPAQADVRATATVATTEATASADDLPF